MTTLAPRPGLMEITPYVGGESGLPGRQRVIKLASNEGALGPSPKAAAAYRGIVETLHRYPDGGCNDLRRALGELHGLDAERIVCGAGSDELISLLCRAYAGPGDEVLHSAHGFLMYAISARSVGATPVAVPEADLETGLTADVDALIGRISEKTRILFLANPNNPTGTYLSADQVKRLRQGLPDRVLLVIDAAYAEFVTQNDYSAGIDLVEGADNVVMIRTFSKIYALGGLRLGWAYCPAAVADLLNRARSPFNVASSAQAAGVAALKDIAFVDEARVHNDTWRAWTTEQVRQLGLAAPPSYGNFILVGFPGPPDQGAHRADAFLRERGIIVRRMDAYGLPGSLRVSIGLEAEMRAFIDALAAFIQTGQVGR